MYYLLLNKWIGLSSNIRHLTDNHQVKYIFLSFWIIYFYYKVSVTSTHFSLCVFLYICFGHIRHFWIHTYWLENLSRAAARFIIVFHNRLPCSSCIFVILCTVRRTGDIWIYIYNKTTQIVECIMMRSHSDRHCKYRVIEPIGMATIDRDFIALLQIN